jgi:hypothetical protein
MENGVSEPALTKRVGVIRFELGRFTISPPRLNASGHWWVVPIANRGQGMTSYTFDSLLKRNPSLNDHLYAWADTNTDGRVMIGFDGLWFKQQEDAVLFWMTFK